MGNLRAVAAIALGLGVYIAGSFTAYGSGAPAAPKEQVTQDWPAYGGHDGTHYSSLSQINRGNVKNLVVAWKYDTGEKGGLEVNPIIVGKVLYACTPAGSVIALDAATGKLLWKFAPAVPGRLLTRGVSYWTDGHESRIFAGFRSYVYAIDATTGKGIPSFGEDGRIDLRKGLRGNYLENTVALTTPGSIFKDLIIVGGSNPETHPAPAVAASRCIAPSIRRYPARRAVGRPLPPAPARR